MATSKTAAPKAKAKTAKPAAPRATKAPAVAKAASSPLKDTQTLASVAAESPPPDVLRKKELVDRVVIMSGVKKRDVKPVVEATLKVLGDALASGESLALPPFGRAKVNRHKDLASGEVMMVRVRRSAEQTAATGIETSTAAPLAEAAE